MVASSPGAARIFVVGGVEATAEEPVEKSGQDAALGI